MTLNLNHNNYFKITKTNLNEEFLLEQTYLLEMIDFYYKNDINLFKSEIKTNSLKKEIKDKIINLMKDNNNEYFKSSILEKEFIILNNKLKY